jgi:DNA integrity scanning protein DisA with diadenylate cyclase activity
LGYHPSNLAVLFGDQIKIIDEANARISECPQILSSIVGFSSSSSHDDSVNLLIQLAVSMRAHGRGGALIVVPADTSDFQNSLLHPLKYSIDPPYQGLSNLVKKQEEQRHFKDWQGEVKKEIEKIAGLTAIDGATVIDDSYNMLSFGAKLLRQDGKPVIDQLFYTEPVIGGKSNKIDPNQMGGTRHLSAAQFVQDHNDCIALVASQDGRFTIFSWSSCEKLVHAHRIDILLL